MQTPGIARNLRRDSLQKNRVNQARSAAVKKLPKI
jgi:hypothetical protein